jgi:hypothetical protein
MGKISKRKKGEGTGGPRGLKRTIYIYIMHVTYITHTQDR